MEKNIYIYRDSLIAQMVKKSACNAGDPGLIPGPGRPPGEGNGNPLQYSCLENSMDRPWGLRVRHDWVTNTFTFFTSYDHLKVHPCYCKSHYFIPFYGWEVFHCIYLPLLLYSFICPWTLRLLPCLQFSSVQSLSRVRLFATPWIAACQTSLSITNSWSSLRLTSIELAMPSSHLILCHPLFHLFQWVNSSHEVAKVLTSCK